MDDLFLVLEILFAALISGLIGSLIGKRKGRSGAGFFFSFLLGPLGWLIIALGPNAHDLPNKPNLKKLGNVMSELPAAPRLTPTPELRKLSLPRKVPCPHCGGSINERDLQAGSAECPHCKKPIEVVTE